MSLTLIKVLLLSTLLINNSLNVHSWGFVGHSLVARLAQTQLTSETSAWVRKLIPWHWDGELAAMSTWADQILYNASNPTGYPNWQWSRPHHFVNTPDWSCDYQQERDCSNQHCIHTAILNYTSRLKDDLSEIQHQEALYFLIHHLGDIHQPLHTGFASDYGGNSVRGFFLNNTRLTNLHTLWDSLLITHRLNENFSSNASLYYDYLHDLLIQEFLQAKNIDQTEEWIRENLRLICDQIYFDENGDKMNRTIRFRLDQQYYKRNIIIVEERLILAGIRLGRLLNRIVAERSKPISIEIRMRNIWIIVGIAALVVFLLLIVIFIVIYRKKKN